MTRYSIWTAPSDLDWRDSVDPEELPYTSEEEGDERMSTGKELMTAITQVMRKHGLDGGATTEQVREAVRKERQPGESVLTGFQIGGVLSRMVREGKMTRGTPSDPKAWVLPKE